MARHYKMHGLAGFKEDAFEILSTGAGVVAGVAAAKAVTGYVESMTWAQPTAESPKKWVPYASAAIPLAVGVGVVMAADKYKLAGNARKAALGVAAGMAAVSVGKVVVAFSPDFAKKLYLSGLGAVDTYDSGLLAGLGEMDASVARYMMAGSPTQVQALAGAPIMVTTQPDRRAGSPTQIQPLSGAPMSATLM